MTRDPEKSAEETRNDGKMAFELKFHCPAKRVSRLNLANPWLVFMIFMRGAPREMFPKREREGKWG